MYIITKRDDEDFIRKLHNVFFSGLMVKSVKPKMGIHFDYDDSPRKKLPKGVWRIQGADIFDPEEWDTSITLERITISKEKREGARFVLVNQPLSLEEVTQHYPNALVLGYAHDEQERKKLSRLFSPNTFVLALNPKKGKIHDRVEICGKPVALRYLSYDSIDDTLIDSGVSGIVTYNNVNAILAEALRRTVFDYPEKPESSNCAIPCMAVYEYFFTQEFVLAKGDREKQLDELFRYSPLYGKLKHLEYPLIGNIHTACWRWREERPIDGFVKADDCIQERTWGMFVAFYRQLKRAYEKVGVPIPQKKI